MVISCMYYGLTWFIAIIFILKFCVGNNCNMVCTCIRMFRSMLFFVNIQDPFWNMNLVLLRFFLCKYTIKKVFSDLTSSSMELQRPFFINSFWTRMFFFIQGPMTAIYDYCNRISHYVIRCPFYLAMFYTFIVQISRANVFIEIIHLLIVICILCEYPYS